MTADDPAPPLRLISWNLAARRKTLEAQVAALVAHRPTVVALQEVTATTARILEDRLPRAGWPHVVHGFALAPDRSVLIGPRRVGELLASRWPLVPHAAERFKIPWPERVVSATIRACGVELDLHTVHVPPGVSHRWIKIETLEGLFGGLAHAAERPRVVCGDFNTPQEETPDGRVITWAYRKRPTGYRLVAALGERWDRGERNVLLGLACFDLVDVYRQLHGYAAPAFSWYWGRGSRRVGRRFDHVFASSQLRPTRCVYLHALREQGLSDHAPLLTDFASGPQEPLPLEGGAAEEADLPGGSSEPRPARA